MKKKVRMFYYKRIEFDVEMEQQEIDKIITEGVPDWVDEKANEIDNEQPAEFEMFKVIKEKGD